MIKALPLITISPPSEHDESPSISIDRATFSQLATNFARVRAFYPILVFGSYGKSCLLASIMRLAGHASGEESGFECGDNDPDGVYVCPQPLQLGATTILLMKMRGSPRLDDVDVRRRVRACVVPLSLFCLMKEEMTKSLEEIQIFAQDYYLLRGKLGMETAKLLVCAENSGWYKKNPCKLPFENLANKHGRLFEVRVPDNTGLWLRPDDLLSESLKAPYTRTRADLSGDNPYCIHQFLTILSLFVRTADMSPTFAAFLGNTPNPRDPAAEQQLERVNLAVISTKRIQNSAEALEFVVKQESAVGYAFDQRTLETIQRNYMLAEPTVVLVVMGAPGLGKSTLLNHIIQHCIESPHCTNLFTTGNTGNHTTRGSQVLSHPLYYKRHQIMIVDLEGLGGTETLDRTKGVLQANLVSALLAVASVPCILVKNEAVSLEFAKRTITQLAKLQESFGFKIERIYLLFHDLNPGAPLNIDFEGFRIGVNSKFFQGIEVVKMLNKPNFKEANGDENRRLFLDSFINESLYFKKNVSDSYVNISELITYIGVIAKHQNTNLSQLTLKMTEVKEYDRFVGCLHTKLKEIIGNLKSPNSVPLLSFFNEQIRLVLEPQMNAKLASMDNGLQVHCRFRADLDIESAKAPFTEIEAYYNFIRVVPEAQMVENIKQIVDGYHKAAWSIVAFLPRLELLETRLRQVQYHIPESQVKMTAILRALESKKKSCYAWTAVGYTMQTALAVVTFGASTVVTAGGSIAYSLAAAERGVNMGLETTNLETLGAALGQSAGPTWAAGICTNLIFPKRATELIWINSAWGNGQINEEVLGPLKRRLRNKTPVILIIGSKATTTSDFANCFMRYISPFTLEEFAAFHPNKYTQTLNFDYFNPGICETALPGCVLCLRMKKKPGSAHSQTMLKIAEVLMPIASVACLLVDRCSSYSHALLNTLCPQRAPDDNLKAAVMSTKVVVISSNREAVEDLQSALTRGYVAHDVRQVTSFSKSALALTVGTIKDALDNSEPQAATLVMEKITSLPSCLQAMTRH